MADANGRSLAYVIAELTDEFKEFLQTRFSLMASEMRGKVVALKENLPMLVASGGLLLTAWFLLTGALVAAVSVIFRGSEFAWAIALLIVGGGYALFGAIAMLFAYRELSEMGVLPHRTIQVLEEDRAWLKQEARSEV